VNTGLLQDFLLRYAELASDFSWHERAFDQTWEEFEAYTTSGEAVLEVTSLLHHVRLAGDSVPLGDLVTIHALRERDKEQIWARIRREGSTYLEQPYGWDAAFKTRITWRRGQHSALQQGRDLHEMGLAALRLLRPGRPALSVSFADPVSPGAAFASPGVGLSDLIGWGDPVWGDPLELSGDERGELERLLSAYRARKDDPELAFALRRFFLSYGRQLAEDRLVDGWIALESLFGDPKTRRTSRTA
jgi:hypothetical protein